MPMKVGTVRNKTLDHGTMEFPNRIGEHRINAKLTQRGLAKLVEVDISTLRRVENGAQPAPTYLVNKLAKALNCEPIDFQVDQEEAGEALFGALLQEAARVKPPHRRFALSILQALRKMK